MNLRRGITLGCVSFGCAAITKAAISLWGDSWALLIGGGLLFLLAAIYWHITTPTIPYR